MCFILFHLHINDIVSIYLDIKAKYIYFPFIIEMDWFMHKSGKTADLVGVLRILLVLNLILP